MATAKKNGLGKGLDSLITNKVNTAKTTTATKKDEQAKPKSATGTYNGFADTSSVEIEMSDGSYQTFMVNDEDLVNKLNDMDEGTKITFTYGAVEGQANMEILSIE